VTDSNATTAAEDFPGLYRAILDGVDDLERLGRRAEAARIRKAATAAYSGAWGAAGHRKLQLQLDRLARALGASERTAEMTLGHGVAVRPPVGSVFRRLRLAR
jgi:hypothetical protein